IKLSANKANWLKLNLSLPDSQNQQEWLFEFFAQEKNVAIELFEINDKGKITPLTHQEQTYRILKGRKFNSSVYPFTLFKNTNLTLLVKVVPTENINASASIWNPSYIENTNNQISSIIGIFYGVLLLIFI